MTTTLGVSAARSQLSALVEAGRRWSARYVITVNGEPAAVLMSHAEFEAWQATLEVLCSPEEVAAIARGLARFAARSTRQEGEDASLNAT